MIPVLENNEQTLKAPQSREDWDIRANEMNSKISDEVNLKFVVVPVMSYRIMPIPKDKEVEFNNLDDSSKHSFVAGLVKGEIEKGIVLDKKD